MHTIAADYGRLCFEQSNNNNTTMVHLLTKVTPRIPARVTRQALRDYCEDINTLLSEHGIRYRIESEGRNGYVAVDLYDTTTNKCLENIACGTSRECAIETHTLALIALVNDARNKNKNQPVRRLVTV